MRILEALRDYFSDLFSGDPVALIFTLAFLAICLVVCLIWWKAAPHLRREDEERQHKRYGGKKKETKR